MAWDKKKGSVIWERADTKDTEKSCDMNTYDLLGERIKPQRTTALSNFQINFPNFQN